MNGNYPHFKATTPNRVHGYVDRRKGGHVIQRRRVHALNILWHFLCRSVYRAIYRVFEVRVRVASWITHCRPYVLFRSEEGHTMPVRRVPSGPFFRELRYQYTFRGLEDFFHDGNERLP